MESVAGLMEIQQGQYSYAFAQGTAKGTGLCWVGKGLLVALETEHPQGWLDCN